MEEEISMRVVVTGGAGFIGSTVVAELQKRGIPITVFDSFVSGKREKIPEGVRVVQGDVRNHTALMLAFGKATHVVHLAAVVSVPESVADPLLTHEVNVNGMSQVLEAARQSGVSRVIYASSAAVYGDEPTLPKHETSPFAPRSPYALSKIQNEYLARFYADIHKVTNVGFRFFNVYGPGQTGDHKYASVVPRWIEAIRKDETIEVYGDGSQTRDFIHVRDVARIICDALTILDLPTGAVFNVASGKETSLKELRDIIASKFGREVTWKTHPARPGDIIRSVADVGEAFRVFGFTPSISLEEGIAELVQ